jgi:hypothetical protein
MVSSSTPVTGVVPVAELDQKGLAKLTGLDATERFATVPSNQNVAA